MDKVYVIMGNDYPMTVFSTEAAAEKYVADKMSEERDHLKPWESPRIYWRSYEFELDALL